MAYTYEQALAKWKECATLADFNELIENTSAQIEEAGANATHILYSGRIGDESTSYIASEIAKGNSNVYTIKDTPLGKLLNEPGFEKSYFQARQRYHIENTPGFAELSKAEQGKVLIPEHNLAWGGSKDSSSPRTNYDSIWDKASAKYVREASGEFRVISVGTTDTSVYYKSELPELLKNKNIKFIEGIPREDLVSLSIDDAFKNIQYMSGMRVDASGLANGNYDKWLNITTEDLADPKFIRKMQEKVSNFSDHERAEFNKSRDFFASKGAKWTKHLPLVGNFMLGAALTMTAPGLNFRACTFSVPEIQPRRTCFTPVSHSHAQMASLRVCPAARPARCRSASGREA